MNTSKIYDLTHTLDNSTQIYPGDPHFTSTPIASIKSDGYSVHHLTLGSHTGTHIDAPSHFILSGLTIDQIPLSQLIGPAVLVNLSSQNLQSKQKISWNHHFKNFVEEFVPGSIVLIYTGWYKKWGTPEYYDHPILTKDVAQGLLACGVRVVGVDTLNPDETVLDGESENGFEFHEVILGAGGIIAENLTNLEPLVGMQDLFVSLVPLKLAGVDGSPIRAIAWQMA